MAWAKRFLELARPSQGGSPEASSELKELLEICASFGMNAEQLGADLVALAEERLAMWLLGDIPPALNFIERSELLTARLSNLAETDVRQRPGFAKLIDALVESHAQIVANASTRKDGIASIPEPVLTALHVAQGYRCALCGVPIASRVAGRCARFSNGREPVLESDLDHTVPYYLGGNTGNLRVLCKPCNILKNDRLGVQEDALVVVGNHLRRHRRAATSRRAALWTLEVMGRCRSAGCSMTARDSILWVRRTRQAAPWTLGNLVAECTEHAADNSIWIHATSQSDAHDDD